MKRKILSLIITILYALIAFYLFLPSINIHDISFWTYTFSIITIFIISNILLDIKDTNLLNIAKYKISKENIVLGSLIVISFMFILMINFIASPLFNSKKYASRIIIDNNASFTEDVKTVDFKSLPLIDKDSSTKLGDRVMGQMPELVSQYDVSPLYTQINYNDKVVRVTPLEYNGLIKYINNHKEGVKGYITVDSVNGEAKLTKLEQGMKYMPSAILNKDLNRKLRFNYPTKIFGSWSFELDEEGNPYWVIPTIKYQAIGLRKDIEGLIILNPIDGKSTYYEIGNIPTWIDNVYKANIIIEQINDWGKYKKGFLNSIFGQKEVVATTEGYNYLALNDDIYLYTGITSILSDEANIGFVLTNMRTKETKFYSIPGAEEYSAMASSEGQVQQMKYKSTFPLLINLNNKPTYLMSLKDNAGLVKMYSFVDVADYQKVVVTDSSLGIEKASENYLEKFKEITNELKTKTITIKTISSYVMNGNSYFYITDKENNKYKAIITISDKLPFLKQEEEIEITYIENKINEITELN